jgi:uncharacterized protein (DUF2236 family)
MERLVSRLELESLLASIAHRPEDQRRDPRAGIFGPSSVTWKINREAALFLGAGRAALLQLAHPWVATALTQHSSLLGDPIARFQNTFRIVFTMIFGSVGQAFAASRHLHTLHTGIRGEMSDTVAAWPRGSHYEANEIAALRWVFATLVASAVLAYECVGHLSDAEREQYYEESKTTAALFGIPADALPRDWAAFDEYCRAMVASDTLGVSPTARSMGHAILSGAGSWIRPPRWYRTLTVGWLPVRIRNEFGLPLSLRGERAAARARRWLPRLWKMLPPFLRFVGPYREAMARISNHSVSGFTRISNRFWIGQSHLPFTEEPWKSPPPVTY